ncbi:hypothetical protein BDC45DRAFT_576688 [Circinella umbellata]|nr:hypothetical protein BDC45DRAFT_576688 [Circinella umbellata]
MIIFLVDHTGHIPGSIDDLVSAPISRSVKKTLSDLVDQNLDWQNIKHMLRVDREILEKILAGNTAEIPNVLRITYQEVYYLMTQSLQKRAYRDSDMGESLIKWKSFILLRENSRVVCLDSTHGTCVGYDRERCFLYTLVARSDTTGKGAPFCWMITNSEAHQPVEHWL